MSLTRDAYAKEVLRVAEAALTRNENPECPHEKCEEHLSVVYSSVLRKRSIVCPEHGVIFYEQHADPNEALDWEAAEERAEHDYLDSDWDEDDEEYDEDIEFND